MERCPSGCAVEVEKKEIAEVVMSVDIIIKAINEKRFLSVSYDGGLRKIAPCCYGKGTNNQELLRCWQESGFSQSGTLPAWRLMTVAKMQNIQLLDDIFSIPPGYNANGDKAIPDVIAKI